MLDIKSFMIDVVSFFFYQFWTGCQNIFFFFICHACCLHHDSRKIHNVGVVYPLYIIQNQSDGTQALCHLPPFPSFFSPVHPLVFCVVYNIW